LHAHFAYLRENRTKKIQQRDIDQKTWKMHKELTTMKMKSGGCMSAWVMQGHNQMGMEKAKRKA
jgi:hypothetical protein